MSEALLPCPFCGGEAVLESNELRYGTTYSVYCQKCGAEIAGFSEHEAIAAWKRRADARQLALKTRVCPMCADCPHEGSHENGLKYGVLAWLQQPVKEELI